MRSVACVRFRRLFAFPPAHFRPARDRFFFRIAPADPVDFRSPQFI
jgi:hypothetical protein